MEQKRTFPEAGVVVTLGNGLTTMAKGVVVLLALVVDKQAPPDVSPVTSSEITSPLVNCVAGALGSLLTTMLIDWVAPKVVVPFFQV